MLREEISNNRKYIMRKEYAWDIDPKKGIPIKEDPRWKAISDRIIEHSAKDHEKEKEATRREMLV